MTVDTSPASGQRTERTIGSLWQEAAGRPSTAFVVPAGRAWEEITWTEAARRVDALSCGLLALGIHAGDRVAILSRTRLEWTLCDYALASIGAVVVPIYDESIGAQCAHVLSDSAVRALIVEDLAQWRKVEPFRDQLPSLEHLVAIDGPIDGLVSLSDLADRGGALEREDPDALRAARARVRPDDVLTHIYTSGTGGTPKGCIITHGNFAAMIDSVSRIEGLFEPGDIGLLCLPLAHNFARLIQFAAAGVGFSLAYCDIRSVPRALTEVEPTLFPSVPRLYEKAFSTARSRMRAAPRRKRWLGAWAMDVGMRASRARQRGRPPWPPLALQLALADRLVLRRIRERFGGRLRLAVSGGAPLSPEVLEFFSACGVLILEGYGLSESTSAATANAPGGYRFGTVGRALPDFEIRTSDAGEVLIRSGTIFAGYHGDAEATAAAVDADGWLHTGDLGEVDEDGFLRITGRIKDLIVTSGGKKVAPEPIENAIKASGLVSQALVVGDRRQFITALLAPDPEHVAGMDADEVRRLLEAVVADVNSRLGPVERIRRFAVLSREFSADHGEITPTLKVRRAVCEDHFRAEIDALYREAPS
jgi:long-chain acyl-CoA synthetase